MKRTVVTVGLCTLMLGLGVLVGRWSTRTSIPLPISVPMGAIGTMPFYPRTSNDTVFTDFRVDAPPATVIAQYRDQWAAQGWTVMAPTVNGDTTTIRVEYLFSLEPDYHSCKRQGQFRVKEYRAPGYEPISRVDTALSTACIGPHR